jgi:hypothetical protein
MFISEHHKNKVWTNHERESAQARAFENNREYILPAFFDESVKIPGVLKTTGRISLAKRTPEELASLIVKKLEGSGVELSAEFAYSEEAKADVDFPRPKGDKVSELLDALQSAPLTAYPSSALPDAAQKPDVDTNLRESIDPRPEGLLFLSDRGHCRQQWARRDILTTRSLRCDFPWILQR